MFCKEWTLKSINLGEWSIWGRQLHQSYKFTEPPHNQANTREVAIDALLVFETQNQKDPEYYYLKFDFCSLRLVASAVANLNTLRLSGYFGDKVEKVKKSFCPIIFLLCIVRKILIQISRVIVMGRLEIVLPLLD